MMTDESIFDIAREHADTPKEEALNLGLLLAGKLFEQSSNMSRSLLDGTIEHRNQLMDASTEAQDALYDALEYVAPRSEAADCIRTALRALQGWKERSAVSR